uniref:THD domain-containing protein n=1 Tax=Magallana gigas TaxID=29159 RepID=K1R0F6_MAGGI
MGHRCAVWKIKAWQVSYERKVCQDKGPRADIGRGLIKGVLKIGESEKPIDKDSFSWWRERPNSAHLYLKDLYRTQLHWTATEETGSAFSNLSIVDQNKLVIEKTGHYFVYAAVVFDFRTVTKVPQVYYNITGFLPVISRFTFVLMGKYGGSPFSEKRHTGYLCGISEFYKGHQISVSVNDHSFIDNTPYANFFGIFKL